MKERTSEIEERILHPAQNLFEMIRALPDTEYVVIEYPVGSGKRLLVDYNVEEWSTILFLDHEDDDRVLEKIEKKLKKRGLDKDFYFWFLVGPLDEMEQDDWEHARFYTDKATLEMIADEKIIGHRLEEMPYEIYSLAWDEAWRIYTADDIINS